MTAPIKWYLRPVAIVIAILCLGPFALPLVWVSPAFKRWQKAAITAILILITIWLAKMTADVAQDVMKRLQELQAAMR